MYRFDSNKLSMIQKAKNINTPAFKAADPDFLFFPINTIILQCKRYLQVYYHFFSAEL